jgi:hypothetical protein
VKRAIGLILAGLGGFLLVLAGMLKFYVVPSLAKAPLSPGEDNPDGITVSLNEGTAEQLIDPGALASGGDPIRTNVPLVSTRFTRGDVQAAETQEAKDQDLAIYDSFSRLTDPAGTVINADTIRVAFNRVSSELVNCCGANYDGDEVTFEGINPLKFPMFTAQQDYDYFDSTLLKAWPAVYQGEEELFGATTYKFVMTIPPTKVGELTVPGSLVESEEPSVTVDEMYANIRTLNVEPTTGSIVKGVEQQNQFFQAPNGATVPKIKATIGAPDAEVEKSVNSAMESANLLNMMNKTVPLVALVLGVLALIGGILLARKPKDVLAG